jgi:teichoic acid transport system permease protein
MGDRGRLVAPGDLLDGAVAENAGSPPSGQAASERLGTEQPGSGQASDGQAGSGQAGDGQAGSGQAGDGQAGSGQAGDGQAGDGQADDGQSLAELAALHGLRPSSVRPGLLTYLGRVWARRHFILAYATARNVSMYTEARLGQLWQVLTPLLNSAVYYLVFGYLFRQNRGIEHYIGYLVTGVFIFSFSERSIVVGSGVMRANISLIRALYFPRACLPLAYVLVEFEQLLLSMIVLITIVLADGEPLTFYWLLLVPALLLQSMFNMGAALLMARFGSGSQDISQLIPFLMRVWRYFCGVMYSIGSLSASLPLWAKDLLSVNPIAVYISLIRFAIMASQRANAPGAKPYNAGQCTAFNATKIPALQAYCHPYVLTSELWLAGIGWAVVTLAVGIVFFWQAETRYGRG